MLIKVNDLPKYLQESDYLKQVTKDEIHIEMKVYQPSIDKNSTSEQISNFFDTLQMMLLTRIDNQIYEMLFSLRERVDFVEIVNICQQLQDDFVVEKIKIIVCTPIEELCDKVIIKGYEDMFNFIISKKQIFLTTNSFFSTRSVSHAVYHGHINLVSRLRNDFDCPVHSIVFNYAAKRGDLEMLKHLYENRFNYDIKPTCAITLLSAKFGHIECLKFAIKNNFGDGGYDGYDENYYPVLGNDVYNDPEVGYGKTDNMSLLQIRQKPIVGEYFVNPDVKSLNIVSCAALSGNYECMVLAVENNLFEPTNSWTVLETILNGGSVKCFDYAWDNWETVVNNDDEDDDMPKIITEYMIQHACRSGSFELVKHLYKIAEDNGYEIEKNKNIYSGPLENCMCKNTPEAVKIFKYLVKEKGYKVDDDLMDSAINTYNSSLFVKCLHEDYNLGVDIKYFYIFYGSIQIIKKLHKEKKEGKFLDPWERRDYDVKDRMIEVYIYMRDKLDFLNRLKKYYAEIHKK